MHWQPSPKAACCPQQLGASAMLCPICAMELTPGITPHTSQQIVPTTLNRCGLKSRQNARIWWRMWMSKTPLTARTICARSDATRWAHWTACRRMRVTITLIGSLSLGMETPGITMCRWGSSFQARSRSTAHPSTLLSSACIKWFAAWFIRTHADVVWVAAPGTLSLTIKGFTLWNSLKPCDHQNLCSCCDDLHLGIPVPALFPTALRAARPQRCSLYSK